MAPHVLLRLAEEQGSATEAPGLAGLLAGVAELPFAPCLLLEFRLLGWRTLDAGVIRVLNLKHIFAI